MRTDRSTVLVTDARGLRALAPSWPRRVFARWRGAASDRRLAAGTPPESTVLLSTRAAQLVTPRSCAALACDWLALADRAARGPMRRSAVPIAHTALRESAGLIDELATVLTRPGPLSAAGVAAARILLTDAAGPVYRTERDLPSALSGVLARLTDPVERPRHRLQQHRRRNHRPAR